MVSGTSYLLPLCSPLPLSPLSSLLILYFLFFWFSLVFSCLLIISSPPSYPFHFQNIISGLIRLTKSLVSVGVWNGNVMIQLLSARSLVVCVYLCVMRVCVSQRAGSACLEMTSFWDASWGRASLERCMMGCIKAQ